MNWDLGADRLVINSVVNGTVGAQAGLLPGDELLAINGERVLKSGFDRRMRQLEPGERVELLLARRGRIMTVSLLLAVSRPERYFIGLDEDASQRSLRRLERWLGQDLPR